MIQIITEHLIIRPYQESDFPDFYRLAADPVAMKFIRPAATEEGPVRERLDAMKAYRAENPGLGSFIIRRASNGEAVGNMVLRHADWKPEREMEVGYGINPEYWGQGLASEALRGLMNYALTEMEQTFLVAFTDENNGASNRVLEKQGFVRVGIEIIYENECVRWEYR